MSSDDQLNVELERIVQGLRVQLEGTLRAASDEIRRHVAAEHERAVAATTAEVRRETQEQLSQLREATQKQNDEVRASAEARIAELRRTLDEVRRNASQQADAAQQQASAVRLRAAAEVDEFRRAAQHLVDDINRSAEQRVAELAQALRSLDASRSLTDVLERLLTLARAVADRSALWLVEADHLQEWRTSGVEAAVSPAERQLAEAAVRERRPQSRTGEGEREQTAIPITVAGVAVAVLYADVSRPRTGGRAWADALEMVTRHASRVLEATTVQQAAAMLAPEAMARHSQIVPGRPRPGSVS